MKFSFADKFRLEIRWGKVFYEVGDIALFSNCFLSGPAINELLKLNEEDFIDLDFSNQYKIFIPSYYIARFSWSGVNYKDNKILLNNVILKNKHINSVPKLKSDDFIVLDMSDHVDTKHYMYLTYKAYLLNRDGILYNF